jgi:hypothetical protein
MVKFLRSTGLRSVTISGYAWHAWVTRDSLYLGKGNSEAKIGIESGVKHGNEWPARPFHPAVSIVP